VVFIQVRQVFEHGSHIIVVELATVTSEGQAAMH
jgi:hypothetical protein